MEIPLYLAMTASELRNCRSLPQNIAWLSCLFSPYGWGISNTPRQLPPNSLLILSDRTPICGHDPELIYQMLLSTINQFSCNGLLLDFESSSLADVELVIQKLLKLPCPIAVPAAYAKNFDCPVFTPPCPADVPLEEHLSPWNGREIWQEVSTVPLAIAVTESGTTICQPQSRATLPRIDTSLCCQYGIKLTDQAAIFTLQRTEENWRELLAKTSCHITKAIGLYQEFA